MAVGAETSRPATGGPAGAVDVVALVTSAGGLGALSAVLGDLPEDLPAAVVIGQHLSGQGSLLVEILARRTALPVEWARDGGRIAPGRVFVCPPASAMEVLPDGSFAVRPIERGIHDRPLDALLASVGDSYGARAVGVVLTGMGRDGARGAAQLRAAGGVMIAQDEDTAEQPAMPRAATEAGVDRVLPLGAIGRVVADVVAGEPLPPAAGELDAIFEAFGGEGIAAGLARAIDWSGTPLGAVASWSPVLRSTVRLMMRSKRAVGLVWGDQYVWFMNDAGLASGGEEYRAAFGRSYYDAFPSLVAETVPVFDEARAGRSVLLPAQHSLLERGGRRVDAWFDAAFTAVHDLDGTAAGVYFDFFDRTAETLYARRLSMLNRLGRIPRGPGRREVLASAVGVLEASADVLFAAAYVLDGSGRGADLVAAAGTAAGGALTPSRMHVARGAAWPLHRLVETGAPIVVEDLAERFRGHVAGADRLPPEGAVLHPLHDVASGDVTGALILGVNPRAPLDEAYREFLALAGETIATRAGEAEAARRERERGQRLTELDRAKTEFFSNVSHEFRTPLTLMLGPLEEILRDADGLTAAQAADLELVRRNAERLLRLVGTLLDFSQLEAGRIRARFVPVDLAARTREIAAQFESAAARAGLRLDIDVRDLPEPVWVDPEMWEKIVSNLLSNALKFTLEGGVSLSLRPLPKHVELVVRDTGCGIPPEDLPHVFKRFHRVPGAPARTREGAGIGLALVMELVRRHHGRIRATSPPGEGATFTVWIPLGRRPDAGGDSEGPAAPTGVAAALAEEALGWADAPEDRSRVAAADGRGLRRYAPGARILVVDDHRDMRDYLARLLGEHWGVETARDGEEALAAVRRSRPDLVVTDVMMPGLDGFGLLGAIREDPALAGTPVVLVTARAGEEAAIEGLLAGADDYIVKPFSAREFVARVGGQLELSRARRRAGELNAFRVRLSDALRVLADPEEIGRTACRMLADQLGADGAHLTGAVGDAAAPADPAGARLVVPLPGEGALTVHGRTPRPWTEEDVALAEEVAARAWAEMERARAETALRESEERMRLAVRATGIVTWEWIPSEDRITTSDGFAAMYGLPELAHAADGFALVLPEDAERHVATVRAIAAEGGSYNSRFRIRRPDDGRIVHLEERAEAQLAPDGTVARVIGVTLDVTERDGHGSRPDG